MFKNLITYFNLSIRRFLNDNYTYHASTLTFTTLLAIVPTLLIFVYFVSVFPLFFDIVAVGKQYIFSHFVPTSAVTVQTHFEFFMDQATQLPLSSIIFLMLSTFMLMHTVEQTLNQILGVNRSKYYKLIFHWIFYAFLPFIIGVAILFISYIVSFLNMNNNQFIFTISPFILLIFSLFLNTIVFSIFYTFLPNAKVSAQQGLIGGLIAAILYEALKTLFNVYISFFPTYSLIYGSFATIPILLIWLYCFWCIFIFAGIMTYQIGYRS